jgi:hypothetical protein
MFKKSIHLIFLMVIKKFFSYTILFLILILSTTIILAVPNPGHSADEILISIKGYTMTLQEAYDNNFLKDGAVAPVSDGTKNLDKSHSAENLQIYLKNIGRTSLQDAITNQNSFCTDASGTFSWSFIAGHSADEITFSDGETLQQKINTQKFCSYSWVQGGFGVCSTTCGHGTKTQSVICKRSDEKTNGIADAQCVSDGQGAKPASSEACTAGANNCGIQTSTPSYGACIKNCATNAITRTKTITQTCNVPGFCVGMIPSSTTTETCTSPTQYINKKSETATGPYTTICTIRYSENQWIGNPLANSADKPYAWFNCDFDLSGIRCGSKNDGCIVWFSNHAGDSCYDTPSIPNNDCNAISHLYFGGNIQMSIRGCSLSKAFNCPTSKTNTICY